MEETSALVTGELLVFRAGGCRLGWGLEKDPAGVSLTSPAITEIIIEYMTFTLHHTELCTVCK